MYQFKVKTFIKISFLFQKLTIVNRSWPEGGNHFPGRCGLLRSHISHLSLYKKAQTKTLIPAAKHYANRTV